MDMDIQPITRKILFQVHFQSLVVICDLPPSHRYLGVTGQQYGRPIHGQNEVVGLNRPGVQAKWLTMEGVFINPSDPNEDNRIFHDPSEF